MDLNLVKFLSRIYKSVQNNEDNVYRFCNPLIERSKIMDKYGIRPNDSSSLPLLFFLKLQLTLMTLYWVFRCEAI